MRLFYYLLILFLAAGSIYGSETSVPVLEVSALSKTANNIPGIAYVENFGSLTGVIRLHVQNPQIESNKIILKITDLASPEYGLYIDAEYRGLKKKSFFEEGLTLETRPNYVFAHQSEYLQILSPRVRAVTHLVYQ